MPPRPSLGGTIVPVTSPSSPPPLFLPGWKDSFVFHTAQTGFFIDFDIPLTEAEAPSSTLTYNPFSPHLLDLKRPQQRDFSFIAQDSHRMSF